MSHPHGEQNHQSELTNTQRHEIVALYASGKFLQREIASIYHVARSTISRLVSGETSATITNIKKRTPWQIKLHHLANGSYIDTANQYRFVPLRHSCGKTKEWEVHKSDGTFLATCHTKDEAITFAMADQERNKNHV